MKSVAMAILILMTTTLVAQNQLALEHLNIEDGLANNSVRTIFQDRNGYMWFGTLNGLSRYDGQRFENFFYDPGSPNSISNNKIREIFQDSFGYLWITTYDNLAHRYDPRTESFLNFPDALGEIFAGSTIHFVHESSPGVIWLYLSGRGCVRLVQNQEDGTYTKDWLTENNLLLSNSLSFMENGKQGGLWIGGAQGLVYLKDDKLKLNEKDKLVYYLEDKGVMPTILYEHRDTAWVGCQTGELFEITKGQARLKWKSNHKNQAFNQFSFITESNDGVLYGGTRNGMLQYNLRTGELKHITANKSELSTNYLTGCYKDQQGDLWLISNLRGVTRFIPRSMEFQHFPLQPEIRQSIVEGEKQILLEDKLGNLWVGIYGGGISMFDRGTESFKQYLNEDNNPASLSSNLVLSLFEDRSGNLWTGTYKRGLDKINLQENYFHNELSNEKQNSDFLSENRAVFEDSRQWIWTGNKRGEVLVYDQNFKLLFRLNDYLGENKLSAGVYCFEEDLQHNIWIGTKGNGIKVLTNLPNRVPPAGWQPEFTNFRRLTEPNNISHNDVFDLRLDSEGQMWVAIYHGGINVIKNPLTHKQQIYRYLQNTNDRFSITDNRARCLQQDHLGNMWIGTANGLNFLSREYLESDNKRFISIFQSNAPGSLSYNDIINIYEDSKQQLWIGTYGGGINRLEQITDDREFRFSHITTQNGLSSNLVLGFAEDNQRNLWVSTDFGLCKMKLDSLSFENFYVSDGLKEDSFSEGKGLFNATGHVVFGHLSGLLWFSPEQVQKQERQVPVVLTDLQIKNQTNKEILNLARQQIHAHGKPVKLRYNQNFLTFQFAALDFKAPSKVQYEFKLENYESSWNRNGNLNKAIYRELEPGEYLFRLRATNSDGLWVNPEMQLAITIKPPPWRTGWAYLLYLLIASVVFIIIRRFILERIKLKHEVEFEKQLADEKLKFYTSISHEFKTPLALILGPVEDLLAQKNLPANVSTPLKMVKRNTRRLLELIEQLMDFRKIQKGFLKNEIRPGNLVQFLHEIFETFQPLAEKKKIHFQFSSASERLDANIDYKSLEKIVFNLLSNAFKHTREQQSIELKLETDEIGTKARILVSDTGEGIREQDLPHLFERFTFNRRSNWKEDSSTGIGLSLTKELVDLLEGEISVQSTLGEGSCFTVTIPYAHTEDSAAASNIELDYTQQFIGTHEEADEMQALPVNGRSQIGKAKLLVVEDNPDLRAWLSTQLSLKHEVVQAENGKIGLDLAREIDPDLIICDVMMPEMDGLELTAALKGEFHTSHIPIILLTAKSLEEHKIEGVELGADDYITKPFNMLYLQKRIDNILIQRKQLRERFSRDLKSEPADLSSSKADQEFMTKVIRLVEEQMSTPDFSIDNLLPHFSFGRTVFYKKMKGISGYAPKDFVRILRMKKAAQLLADPSISISEVSFEVGFSDPTYFARQFKKHFGENPSDYQKQLQEKAPTS